MSDTTSLGVWQGNEENYLLWEMVDRNNRGFIIAGWLDTAHICHPFQVPSSYPQKFKIGVSCIIVPNYVPFSPGLSS